MTGTRQILFIQGGGAGAHDEWDDKLVESLRRELGDGYEVRYPRMPDEDDPSYARWSAAIRREHGGLGRRRGRGRPFGGRDDPHQCARRAAAGAGARGDRADRRPVRRRGRLARRRVRVAETSARGCPRRAGARVPWTPGRDRPAVACRPVRPGNPAGAGAPAARAGSPAEQRPERSGEGDPCQRHVPAPMGSTSTEPSFIAAPRCARRGTPRPRSCPHVTEALPQLVGRSHRKPADHAAAQEDLRRAVRAPPPRPAAEDGPGGRPRPG